MDTPCPTSALRAKPYLAADGGYDCAYAPEDLASIYATFDAAWGLIEGEFVSSIARDSARYRLATIILAMAKVRVADVDSIAAVALAALNRRPN